MAAKARAFTPCRQGEKPAVGFVIEIPGKPSPRYLRITHIFDHTLYVMPVEGPEQARYATKPQRRDLAQIARQLAGKAVRLGRLPLPQEFLEPGGATAEGEDDPTELSMAAIQPLVEKFDREDSLRHSEFSAAIRDRANSIDFSEVSLRRLLLRYYYFGRTKNAFHQLRPGRKIGSQRPIGTQFPDPNLTKNISRRGRQPIEAKVLGRNTFITTDEDIADMIQCLEALTKKGITTLVAAHIEYIKSYLSKRHPRIYKLYLKKQFPVPVTYRQYRTYTNDYADLNRDLRRNLPGFGKKVQKGSTLSAGPGEVYEIDATGGRIFLVDSRDSSKEIGTPIIYLIIDRWSRFVVSAYITLRPASWEEIRFALLIAFTPRKRRFANIGATVDEVRWPQGKACARLVMDRGSEMISKAMLDAAANGLLIEPETMPPLCPDGKGILERLNRELKRKMSQRGIKGVFAVRPMDPRSKKVFKAAKAAAAHSLREIYWDLLQIIDEHNNSPHSYLEKRTVLKKAGVRPTPRDAYVWGLENITGIESPPLTEEDYQRLLLGVDKATIANGAITYKNRKYLATNAAAERQAKLSTSRRRTIQIKVDRSDPVDLYAPNGDDEWPKWSINEEGLWQIREMTIEEEDALSDTHRLLIAETRNDAFIEGLQRQDRPLKKNRTTPSEDDGASKRERRTKETRDIQSGLLNKKPVKPLAKPPAKKPTEANRVAVAENWKTIEDRERLETIERQRKARK